MVLDQVGSGWKGVGKRRGDDKGMEWRQACV